MTSLHCINENRKYKINVKIAFNWYKYKSIFLDSAYLLNEIKLEKPFKSCETNIEINETLLSASFKQIRDDAGIR